MCHLMIRVLSPDCIESQTKLHCVSRQLAFQFSSPMGCKDSDDDCDSGIWSIALQDCIQEEDVCADPICRELDDGESSDSNSDPMCDKGPEEPAMDDNRIVLLGEEPINVVNCNQSCFVKNQNVGDALQIKITTTCF